MTKPPSPSELVWVQLPRGLHLTARTHEKLVREAERTGKPLLMIVRAAIERAMKESA